MGVGLPAPGEPSRRRRRLARVARRVGIACVALVLAAIVVFGILLLVTPSVGNAPQLARSFDRAHRAPYTEAPVPDRFAAALEATEDHRFGSEPGIDPVAVLRVMYGKLTAGGDQGGATLYQQLAKMLYTPGQASLSAEAEQIALAVKLRYTFPAAQILRMYANVAYFGQGFYGLDAASCGYFGVLPEQLSWPQAALLAGLVQGPTVDDPLTHQAAGRAREEHVIGRLVAVGAITLAQANTYLAIPMSTLLRGAGACRV
jgi:membrane peptidoglycan carboxypeptidase